MLLLEDGGSVYESRFILEWIEAKYPTPPMLPEDVDARLFARQVEVVADGVCDAVVALFWERHRDPDKQSAEWKARQMRKVDGGMRALAELGRASRSSSSATASAWPTSRRGRCAATSTCGSPSYPWRQTHPALSGYSDRMERRPSFAGSVPVAQVISDKVV